MNKKQYKEYEKAVDDFFHSCGINHISSEGEPYFSHRDCECCRRPLAGDRYKAKAYSPEFGKVCWFEICTDCAYYAEYGQLDDETMIDVETSDMGL